MNRKQFLIFLAIYAVSLALVIVAAVAIKNDIAKTTIFGITTIWSFAALAIMTSLWFIEQNHAAAMSKKWTDALNVIDDRNMALDRKDNKIKRLTHDLSLYRQGKKPVGTDD